MSIVPLHAPAADCRPDRRSTPRRARRSFLPVSESCEPRQLMTIAWHFNITGTLPPVVSPQNGTAHQVSAAAWQRNLQDAGAILSGVLPQWNETINVNVAIAAGGGNNTERAGGSPTQMVTLGQFVRGGTVFNVYEPQDIQAARVGGTAGINLTFDPTNLTNVVSVDESTALNGQTSKTKEDFVSLAIHELIHGLGFIGYRSLASSTFGMSPANNLISSYDALTEPLKALPTSGPLTFDGKRAEAAYGGPVPLTSVLPANATASEKATLGQEAFFHVGNFGDNYSRLDNDPMNGMAFPLGRRFTAANLALDAAMLNDMFSLPKDKENVVVVADTTNANNAYDLSVDVQAFKSLADTALDQDPFSQVDVISYLSGTGQVAESGFLSDLTTANADLAAIKLSGLKGPIPQAAFSQLVALVKKGQTWTKHLGLPTSATVIAFDDMNPVTIAAP